MPQQSPQKTYSPMRITLSDPLKPKTSPSQLRNHLKSASPENKSVLTSPSGKKKSMKIKEAYIPQELLPKAQTPAPQEAPPQRDLSSFLPGASSSYQEQLRGESHSQRIVGDAGDIPVQGDDYTPRNGPKVEKRYESKDLRLYQFSQEFRERFGAVWNQEPRWVPPTSPLRPGDVVYYKVFINGNGEMDHYEHLIRQGMPYKNEGDLDKIFERVVSKVFPMSVPDGLPDHVQIAEVLAIQVVDGNGMGIHFSN